MPLIPAQSRRGSEGCRSQASWFTSHIDRATVEPVLDGLRIALDSGALGQEQARIITGFMELLDEWLSGASE
jgi:hypothetical protein